MRALYGEQLFRHDNRNRRRLGQSEALRYCIGLIAELFNDFLYALTGIFADYAGVVNNTGHGRKGYVRFLGDIGKL